MIRQHMWTIVWCCCAAVSASFSHVKPLRHWPPTTIPVSHERTLPIIDPLDSDNADRYLSSRRHCSKLFTSSTNTNRVINKTLQAYARSVFRWSGPVPIGEALMINCIFFGALSGKLYSMLTPAGFAHAIMLGTGLWATLGWRGWSVCVMYLLFGDIVTKLRYAEKESKGLAEPRGGRRGPENVWGSGATALACAIASNLGNTASHLGPFKRFLGISSGLWVLAYVASLATKLSDTFASEIGKAYGKTTFLVTNMSRVQPGTEGAVSAEGTAASVLGGLLLSLWALYMNLIPTKGVVICTVAAFLATLVESVIGATLQQKKGWTIMTNEVVNFINTSVGAGLALLGGAIFL